MDVETYRVNSMADNGKLLTKLVKSHRIYVPQDTVSNIVSLSSPTIDLVRMKSMSHGKPGEPYCTEMIRPNITVQRNVTPGENGFIERGWVYGHLQFDYNYKPIKVLVKRDTKTPFWTYPLIILMSPIILIKGIYKSISVLWTGVPKW